MTTTIRFYKNTGWWLLIIGLATVLIIIGYSLSVHRANPDPNDIMRYTIAQGIQNNVSKLSCAILVWSSERKGFGPWSNKPEIKGTHQLWWNNKKIALSCETNTTIHDPNGQVSSNQEITFMTYDGKKFRVAEMPTGLTGKVEIGILKKPTERFHHNNYLQTVGWQGRGGLNHISKPTEPGKEDVLQLRRTIQYKQVSGGVWFPISVVTENYNIQNGELIYRSKMEVDIQKSVFNDPSIIPDEAFELEIGPNAEVKDLTSLKTRLKRFLNDF